MQTIVSDSRQTFWLAEGSAQRRCHWRLRPFQHREDRTEVKREGKHVEMEKRSKELMAIVCAMVSSPMAAV